jgi:hypothetical protein
MTSDNQIASYLQRAQEAEIAAVAACNESQKAGWLGIANGYRNLAQARQLYTASVAALEMTSPSPSSQA